MISKFNIFNSKNNLGHRGFMSTDMRGIQQRSLFIVMPEVSVFVNPDSQYRVLAQIFPWVEAAEIVNCYRSKKVDIQNGRRLEEELKISERSWRKKFLYFSKGQTKDNSASGSPRYGPKRERALNEASIANLKSKNSISKNRELGHRV
jgi:hypothetical protein